MLTIAVSLLFGLAAMTALGIIRSSLIAGAARSRLILAELAEIDRAAARTIRPATPRARPEPAFRPAFAAA